MEPKGPRKGQEMAHSGSSQRRLICYSVFRCPLQTSHRLRNYFASAPVTRKNHIAFFEVKAPVLGLPTNDKGWVGLELSRNYPGLASSPWVE